ncbi:MAG: shikimate dehydrogenase [Parachlamydiales bacterium]|nr:shikimate dehydrogenase [Parachlamydiales bacterium]
MLCIPIIGPTLQEAKLQIQKALRFGNLLEFRLDLFEYFEYGEIKKMRESISLPVIFTLRHKRQEASTRKSKTISFQEIYTLALCNPDYFDIEYDLAGACIQDIRQKFPNIQWILSYHNFSRTPKNLTRILKNMKKYPARWYKIACMANSTNDALRMMLFASSHSNIIGLCMGEKGEITRILSPITKNPWSYAAISKSQKSAIGQRTVEELSSVYSYHSIGSTTKIYGLIGSPVHQSISHLSHNTLLRALHCNGVYIKMDMTRKELDEFFRLIKTIPLHGLSITTPLKTEVISFLDYIDIEAQKIGAVNTMTMHQGELHGHNTDGKGALDSIEQHTSVKRKKIAVLGAGGAARAIIYEAKKRGAIVSVFNRDVIKAQFIAKIFQIQGLSLDSVAFYDYDLLINATSSEDPVPKEAIKSSTIAMDIHTVPIMTPFLQKALEKNCRLIFGYEMFIYQAAYQWQYWGFLLQTSEKILQNEVRKILENYRDNPLR